MGKPNAARGAPLLLEDQPIPASVSQRAFNCFGDRAGNVLAVYLDKAKVVIGYGEFERGRATEKDMLSLIPVDESEHVLQLARIDIIVQIVIAHVEFFE